MRNVEVHYIRTSLSEEKIKFTKYKWEFLRRNKKYIEEWENLEKILEEFWDSMHHGSGPDGPIREEIDFCKRWKIFQALCPYDSYDELTDLNISSEPNNESETGCDSVSITATEDSGLIVHKGQLFLDVHKRMHWALQLPEELLGRPITITKGWEYDYDGESLHKYVSDHLAKSGKIEIQIDLNYSKNRLVKEFKYILDDWKKKYEHASENFHFREFCKENEINSHPIGENWMKKFEKTYNKIVKEMKKKYLQKYHFENFDLYLQIFDLREDGESWKKITSTLKLNDIQTARNHYKSACKMIEKGITLYVK